MIARGKLTVEEIAEDADLPIEVVRDLAGLVSIRILEKFWFYFALLVLLWF